LDARDQRLEDLRTAEARCVGGGFVGFGAVDVRTSRSLVDLEPNQSESVSVWSEVVRSQSCLELGQLELKEVDVGDED
jgi:hypothetical protein